MPVQVISRYDYESRAAIAPAVHFDPKKNKADRSQTNQADLEASDINNIMAKYEKTGVLVDGLVERKPMWGDFTEIKSYHETLGALRRADRAFELLPAGLRNRFDNSVQKLIDFLEDPKNDEEAVKLGLKEHDVLLTATGKDGTKVRPQDLEAWNQAVDQKAAEAAKRAAGNAVPAAGQAGGAAGATA